MGAHKAILRKMGYLSDSIGIIDRYIHVGDAWEEHLSNTKQFILNSLKGRHVQNLAIYGSGWLLDLPLDDLSGSIGHVWLYDVIHPPQILHKLRKYKNVTAVTVDITGGALKAVDNAVKSYKKDGLKPDIESFGNFIFTPDQKPDFVVSLNILSQIGDIVTEYLSTHIPLSEADKNRIIYLLQLSHLGFLQKKSSCIITDVEENLFDFSGKLVSTKALVKCSLPEGSLLKIWEWKFDPLGEYNPGFKTVSRVMAIEC
jgi:hypothetical protein